MNIDIENINDEISNAVKRHFPNLSKEEISTAEIGRELRALLPESRKIELFPNKKEIQDILCKTAKDALLPYSFQHMIAHNQLKIKTKDYEDVIGFYYSAGVSPIYTKRYLWLEKLIKKWTKDNGIDVFENYRIYFYKNLSTYFGGGIEGNMSLRNSYWYLANQYYERLKLIKDKLIPEFEMLTDLKLVNDKINYGDNETDRFSGLKRFYESDKRVILVNPVVAILCHDENSDNIIEREALQFIEDSNLRKKCIIAFENLKNYIT